MLPSRKIIGPISIADTIGVRRQNTWRRSRAGASDDLHSARRDCDDQWNERREWPPQEVSRLLRARRSQLGELIEVVYAGPTRGGVELETARRGRQDDCASWVNAGTKPEVELRQSTVARFPALRIETVGTTIR